MQDEGAESPWRMPYISHSPSRRQAPAQQWATRGAVKRGLMAHLLSGEEIEANESARGAADTGQDSAGRESRLCSGEQAQDRRPHLHR
jgi:hypothetical protein